MNPRELDFFLLGCAVGALGAVEAKPDPDDVRAASLVLLKKIERNFSMERINAMERLDSLIATVRGGP